MQAQQQCTRLLNTNEREKGLGCTRLLSTVERELAVSGKGPEHSNGKRLEDWEAKRTEDQGAASSG